MYKDNPDIKMETEEEMTEMATKNEKNNEWKKKNTIVVGLRLFRTTDADIVKYVEHAPNRGKFVKQALRYYVAAGCPEVDKQTDEEE